jgi:hypothetical protein
MTNFRKLSREEYDQVWDRFYDSFKFKPSINEFPAITTDRPQLKFNIANCFSPGYPLDKLEEFAISLFHNISRPGDRLFALDWQHECYDFDPRKEMDRDEFGDWIVPVLPNGDYYIFLAKDFNNVWFGHPWEQTITLIGDEMVANARKIQNGFPG